MRVTKELIENDIVGMEKQIEQLKARLDQSAGALAVLKGMRDFLDKKEEEKVEGEKAAELKEKVKTIKAPKNG